MSKSAVEELIRYIGQNNIMQEKYLCNLEDELTEEEKKSLRHIIDFLSDSYTIEQMAEAYLLFVRDTMEEQKFWVENGMSRYRYSTLEEVQDKVYFNESYMKKYMLGLQISGYIWKNHLQVHRWYQNIMKNFRGNLYLEIGPGHGQYFVEAMACKNFRKYIAIDISPSSIELTEKYIECFGDKDAAYELWCSDFMNLQTSEKFDAVVLSEVLEHVEKPELMLEKIYEITADGADIYVNVPINAPEIDHIYLWKSIEEVEIMLKQAGFIVADFFAAPANGVSLERAVKKKYAINLAYHLKK